MPKVIAIFPKFQQKFLIVQDGQSVTFAQVEMSTTRGHIFKVRGRTFEEEMQEKLFYTESDECL